MGGSWGGGGGGCMLQSPTVLGQKELSTVARTHSTCPVTRTTDGLSPVQHSNDHNSPHLIAADALCSVNISHYVI